MRSLKNYMITGTLTVAILGTLFHFAYEWSGNNIIIGLFTPINESIWEHTKLLFFPMLAFYVYFTKKLKSDFSCISSSMAIGIFSGITLIIVLFYTYFGILGRNISIIDISIFYISVISAFFIAYKLTSNLKICQYDNLLKFFIIVTTILYAIFTFFPPNIPLFISP